MKRVFRVMLRVARPLVLPLDRRSSNRTKLLRSAQEKRGVQMLEVEFLAECVFE
jgi:hypothetical protein